MSGAGRSREVRLAEVVGALSLATDLATGQPLEHALRRSLVALWLGEALGLTPAELSDVYYVSLLGTVGCALEGTVFARYGNDDIALSQRVALVDQGRPIEVATFGLRNFGAGDPPLRRVRRIVAGAVDGLSEFRAVCRDVAVRVGDMFDIGTPVKQALAQCHERWDGSGGPARIRGDDILLPARIFHVAHDAEVHGRVGGRDAAIRVAEARAGTQYDPDVVDRFRAVAGDLLARLEAEPAWDAILSAEPDPRRMVVDDELDELLRSMANFVDARSVHTVGHSPGVASLAEQTARGLGLSDDDARTVRRAGLLHDLGRTGVPVAVWDSTDPWTAEDRERARAHPALTEVVLSRSAALGPLGTLASLHHERLDGSGYRGVTEAFLPVAARILIAADLYRTKVESRPHRKALDPREAARSVRSLVDAGQLDGDVVTSMLEAAGHPVPRSRDERPGGLSDRELDVLQLVVRGLSNREIAERLFISPKTVGHHVEHIYTKTGVSTRVGATLFALQHDLVDLPS